MFQINRSTRQCSQLTDEEFDFKEHLTIQEGEELFTIRESDCHVNKLSNIGVGSVNKADIATLGQRREYCAAILYKSQFIFITGGHDGSHKTKCVHRLELSSREFIDAAPLNTGRSAHSMTVVGGTLYVVCGNDDSGLRLDSIEKLNFAEEESTWTQFTVQGLTAR